MSDLLSIGQYQGFFQYGPAYGTPIEGQEAEFRLFIEEYNNGIFNGRIIDWEGFGVTGDVSNVQGFLEGGLISFTKQYPKRLIFDDFGNTTVEEGSPGFTVLYEGHFDMESNNFMGTWEIVQDTFHTPILVIEDISSGTWRLQRTD